MLKKAIVLKSMRTTAGANDWVRLMSNKYPGAKVVDSETLKSFGSISPLPGMPEVNPMPGSSHVIIEEDLSPVVTVLKKGDASDIVKTMVQKGFMKVDGHGPCLTSKWYEMVDDFMSRALKDAFKSVAEYEYEFSGEMNETTEEVLKSFGYIMKALEDAEKLANIAPATENADFGHELRSNTPISDEEAKSGFENDAPEADVRDPKMDGETVTDEARNSATYEGDHNASQEVLAQPSSQTARKSVEAFDDYLYTTFKSVDEARSWKNPDMGVYQVAAVSPSERKLFGEDAKYVVRARHEWFEESITQKSTSTVADKRTQGLTEPESASDDGGTEAVEARAKKVDALKSIIDEVVDELVDDREE